NATDNLVKNIKEGTPKALEAGQKASDEYTRKLNASKKTQETVAGSGAVTGITNPNGIPGTDGAITGAGKGTGTSGSPTQKENTAIATGGTKHTYVTITMKELIGSLNINGKGFKESVREMEDQTIDAMLRVLGTATTASA